MEKDFMLLGCIMGWSDNPLHVMKFDNREVKCISKNKASWWTYKTTLKSFKTWINTKKGQFNPCWENVAVLMLTLQPKIYGFYLQWIKDLAWRSTALFKQVNVICKPWCALSLPSDFAGSQFFTSRIFYITLSC